MCDKKKTSKMSYAEFIQTISIRTGLPRSIIKKILDDGIDIIGNATYEDGQCVEIRNFGVFSTRQASGRNVCLNNVSSFDGYTKFLFKPSSNFTKKYRSMIGEISIKDA